MFSDSQWDGVFGFGKVHPQRFSSQKLHVSSLKYSYIVGLFVISTCRIDTHFLIKITDFGLSEDVFIRNYFRQESAEKAVKLPVKWMAPESLSDGHFSEKSDVVCEAVYLKWLNVLGMFPRACSGHMELLCGRYSVVVRLHILVQIHSLSSRVWRVVIGCLSHTTQPVLTKCEFI